MWEEYSSFEPVLNKVAAVWCSKLAGRFTFAELKSECVLAYSDIFHLKGQRDMPNADFCRMLWRSASNMICSMLNKRKVTVCIDKLQVAGSAQEFEELYKKFWWEYVDKFLSADAKELLRQVVYDTDELSRVHEQRRTTSVYKTALCREDLNRLYIGERGWSGPRVDRAVKEVRQALLVA